jgi:hypothetical protein
MSGRIVRAGIVFLLWDCFVFSAIAQEPEQLPNPKPRAAPAAPIVTYFAYPVVPPRLESRNVWSLFAPDQKGIMRPRVALAPYGSSYYLYNGEPFPWTTTQPRLIMPKTSD